MKPQLRRCAVYTRKSSEEGLEQDFNSLHAQRESCEAFIRSQKGEGWKLVETAYDDGGISGGTMERPGLQRLLADIAMRKIDVVVVYKVDRLTRSLADFAKMVEVFDAHGVSFVAVTQQFNTTSSMGRLTLNILLSFAQFEREVTGERIRDKIAASKKKGMWMGGNVPLGYDVTDRKLVVNEPEAETVRAIYRRYLEAGCVRTLKEGLDRDGIRSKTGNAFSRGALYALLGNPLYIGEIRHKDARHPGQHQTIVDRPLWEAVQQRLADNGPERQANRRVEASPLVGKLFDAAGERLTPSHTVKNGRRYRYYVSRPLVTGIAETAPSGWRLPAHEIERVVADGGAMPLCRQCAGTRPSQDCRRRVGWAGAMGRRTARHRHRDRPYGHGEIGSSSAWEHFHPGRPIPRLLQHVQDRDLWRFVLPGTREIIACVFSHPFDFDRWDGLAEEIEHDPTAIQAEGLAIERKHHKDIAELLGTTTRPMTIGGYCVPIANLPYTLASDAGHALCRGDGDGIIPPFAGTYYDRPGGRTFSLRSSGDFDVSAIARNYGGGGHKNAAGFTMPLGWEGDGDTLNPSAGVRL